MRLIFLAILSLFSSKICAQISLPSLAKSTCDCLYKVSLTSKNKLSFDTEFDKCLQTYISKAKEIDTTINSNADLNNLIQITLRNNCKQFEFIDSVRKNYRSMKVSNQEVSTNYCRNFRKGTFRIKGDTDSSIVIMADTIQILKFEDGTYTKSKIKWLDACTYSLTRLESTNSFEKEFLKQKSKTVVKIISMKGNEVLYEMSIGRNTYLGTFIRIENTSIKENRN